MHTEKLKPCPFCGGPAEFRTEPDVDECGSYSSYGWIQVVCEDCGAQTNEFFCERPEQPNTAEKLEAKEAWNRRCGAPTTDPEELRSRGKWMRLTEPGVCYDEDCIKCSVCGDLWVSNEGTDLPDWKYCPTCGAKMSFEEETDGKADI